MKLIQKQIIIFSGFIVFILFGYFAIGNLNSSQSGGVKTNTNTGVHTSISQSAIETDTGKRLETVANSGTSWGMSPFGSGKPLTEEDEKKPAFKKPNTKWKARTLSGITYVFGEGNPKEVTMKVADLKKDLSEKCPEDYNDPKRVFCTEESGYTSVEVEKHLFAALSDPNWENLITQCEEQLRRLEPATLERSYQASYNRIIHENYLDINNDWIIINPVTGRKVLNVARTNDLAQWLTSGTDAAWYTYNSPVPNPYKNPTCVDKYGTEIIRNLRLASTYYRNPPEVLGPIPQFLIDPKLFKIYN